MQYCQASNTLYTVHDATYKMASPTERNTLQVSLPVHSMVQGTTGLGCMIQCLPHVLCSEGIMSVSYINREEEAVLSKQMMLLPYSCYHQLAQGSFLAYAGV